MIEKVFNEGRVIFQKPHELGAAEIAILAHIDNDGMIVLCQEGRDIVLAPEAIDELVKVLREMKTLAKKYSR